MALSELGEYLKKGATYSAESAAKIVDLKKINEQANLFAGQLSVEMIRILPEILLLAQTGIADLTSVRTQVLDIFAKTFLNSIKVVAKKLGKDLEDDASLLLSGALATRIANVLEVVLNFEKRINKTHPELSKEIINALGNAITLTLAIQCPAMALVFKGFGITEEIQDLLDCKNLQKSIDKLRAKTTEIEKDKNLAPAFKKAEILGSLSFDTGLDISTLEKANLSKEKLITIYNIPANINSASLVHQLNEQAAKIPIDESTAYHKMNKLKLALYEIADDNNLGLTQIEHIKKNIHEKIDEATLILKSTLTKDQTLLQKIHAGNVVGSKIKEFIPKDLGKDIRKKINDEVDKIIGKNLAIVGPDLKQSMQRSPALAANFGLDFRMKAVIQKTASTTQDLVRKR